MQQKQHKRTVKFVGAAATVTFVAAMVAVNVPSASAAPKTIAIRTSGESFAPPAVTNVVVGDTVTITGLGSHPTKSDVFPAGAAPIALTTSNISYKVTVPGKYSYLCVAHSGMQGTFTAVAAAGAPAPQAPAPKAPAPKAPAPQAPAPAKPAAPAAPAAHAAPAPAAAPAAAAAAAVTHKVATSGETFSPKAIDVKVGDTVSITGLSTHPTKSDIFPAGAAPIAMTTSDITYKVTKPGKYTYLCVAHSGMTGSFTATGAAVAGGQAAATPPGTATAGQVSDVPLGGVSTGGGSTAGITHSGLITLGSALLFVAFFMSLNVSRRFARQE